MTDLRNAPTQDRSRKTLDAIMEAADRLFLAKGVDGATNTEIAEEADVSIGSLYRYFPNKEALVAEYLQRYMAELAHQLGGPLPEQTDISQLDELVERLVHRSAIVRRKFVGYGAVRIWRDPNTGIRPSHIVAEAEYALIGSLFENSIYEIDQDQIIRMSRVIVISSYPVLEFLPEVSSREGDLMISEAKRMLSSYIRDRIDVTRLKPAE